MGSSSLTTSFLLQFDSANSAAWIRYAELETQLQDFARARAIYELGVSQSPLAMPELLWKSYIDFETEEGEREIARSLYERLISLSGHVKVWIAYAMFEGEAIPVPRDQRDEDEEDEDAEVKVAPGDPERARQVFEKGYKDLKSKGLKNEVRFRIRVISPPLTLYHYQRVALLNVWKTYEENHGSADDVAKVQAMMPIVSKRRVVDQDTGQTVEGTLLISITLLPVAKDPSDWDLVFADDERESNPTSFKFLQMAHAWKASQAKKPGTTLSGFTAATSTSTKATHDKDTGSDVASSDDEGN